MIEVDGSRGEGGGQIVRTSIALATLTGNDVRLTNIRENRPTQGLSRQHCTAIRAVAGMNDSWVVGNQPGSRELVFRPGEGGPSELVFDVGSAGSISLVLQAMLLSAQSHDSPVRMEIHGGTNVKWAPPIDFYPQVLFPLLSQMGVEAEMEILERGFYPQGGGRVKVTVTPEKELKPLVIEELGELRSVRALSYSQNLPGRIVDEMAWSCQEMLTDLAVIEVEKDVRQGGSTGAGISLAADFRHGMLGASALGSRGTPAQVVGQEAAKDLIVEMEGGGTLDVHAADQLVPYMALAKGVSSFKVWRISKHLLSQMDLLETFLDVSFAIYRLPKGYRIEVIPEEGA